MTLSYTDQMPIFSDGGLCIRMRGKGRDAAVESALIACLDDGAWYDEVWAHCI